MSPKKTTKQDHVVFPEDVKLTRIDSDEASLWHQKVDIRKILRQSIEKRLEMEPDERS